MKRLSVWRAIWLTGLRSQRPFVDAATYVFLFVAVVGAFGGGFASKGSLGGILQGAALPLIIIAAIYWPIFVSGAATHNKPANACLVPSLNRRVRETVALAWLLTMLPFATISYFHPQGLSLLLFSSVSVTATGLYRSGRHRFLGLAAVAFAAFLWEPDLSWLGVGPLAASVALSVGFAAWACKKAFPRGGDRHWAMLDQHASAMARDEIEGSVRLSRSGKARRPVYAFLLRRDLAAKGSRRHLLMHVAGPVAHRMATLLPILVAAACIVLAKPALHALGLSPNMAKVARLTIMSLIVGVPVGWYMIALSIVNSSAEQAIVRLAPGLPGAARLNRELGGQMLSTCVLQWGAVAVLAFGALWMWGQPASSFMTCAGFLGAMLGMAGMALRDYSGKTTQYLGSHIVLLLCSCVLAFVAMFFTEKSYAWTVMMAFIYGASVANITSNWHAMMAAPPAFPAGRLA